MRCLLLFNRIKINLSTRIYFSCLYMFVTFIIIRHLFITCYFKQFNHDRHVFTSFPIIFNHIQSLFNIFQSFFQPFQLNFHQFQLHSVIFNIIFIIFNLIFIIFNSFFIIFQYLFFFIFLLIPTLSSTWILVLTSWIPASK